MADRARPYCGQCHSGAVDSERDPEGGQLIIYCRVCGNRTTKADPLAQTKFYMMAKEGDMKKDKSAEKSESTAWKCPNCRREMSNQGGFCWKCKAAVKFFKEGTPEFDKALADVKTLIDDGKLRNWGRNKVKKVAAKEAAPPPEAPPPACSSCGREDMALEDGKCTICRKQIASATETSDLDGVAEIEALLNENPGFLATAETPMVLDEAESPPAETVADRTADGGGAVIDAVFPKESQEQTPEQGTTGEADGTGLDPVFAELREKHPHLKSYFPKMPSGTAGDSAGQPEPPAATPAVIPSNGNGKRNKRGVCSNCGIEAETRKGMCRPCNNAVKNLAPGSPDYLLSLAKTKERRQAGVKSIITRAHSPAAMPAVLSPVTPDGGVIPLFVKLIVEVDVRVNRAIITS